ncbi:MAG: hypothetical protein NTV34_10735 [Proteobacteria bacterium]|nr:hypothetical protein [Pseudomonadota bacterium]
MTKRIAAVTSSASGTVGNIDELTLSTTLHRRCILLAISSGTA